MYFRSTFTELTVQKVPLQVHPYPQVRAEDGELVVQGTVMSDHESVANTSLWEKGKGKEEDATFPL